MNYETFQIITNGEKFGIRVSIKHSGGVNLGNLTEDGLWCGCEASGFIPIGPMLKFDSRKEAVDYIKKEFGEVGYRKLLENWHPC